MTWFTKMTCFDEKLANEVVHFFPNGRKSEGYTKVIYHRVIMF